MTDDESAISEMRTTSRTVLFFYGGGQCLEKVVKKNTENMYQLPNYNPNILCPSNYKIIV